MIDAAIGLTPDLRRELPERIASGDMLVIRHLDHDEYELIDP